MSVQAGIWNFDGRPINRKLLASISASLKHQGPDGESYRIDGPIALLYRPFHTTAESRREKQPHCSLKGFIMTWDGRLDNREELIDELHSELEADPTDVAIVAAAFDHWESDCFRRFIGDWAISVWKPGERELLFATDYMAIRHIFYYLKNDQVLWSTDLSPLVLLSGDSFHIEDIYIAGYFANDPDAHLTPYREIHQVPPGGFVRIRDGKASISRYWRFTSEFRVRYKNDFEYEEHFRHVFSQSVRRRLRSDSPILAELSGGLDSSSIVCMADHILGKEKVHTRRLDTLSYYDKTEPQGDDWIYFQKIETYRGRIGHHIDASKLGTAPASLQLLEFNACPGFLSSCRNLDAERAAVVRDGGYRVIISGVGGDEFLGGIPNPSDQLADLIMQCRPLELARQLMAWSLVKRRPWIHLLWSAIVNLLPPSIGQYFSKFSKVEPWIDSSFAKRTKLAVRLISVDEHFGLWLPTRRSHIGGVIRMANKLAKWKGGLQPEECRYPYLDQNLIEFTLSIPASQLLRPGERRSLMRRTLAGLVPQDILSRKTKQFSARTPVVALARNLSEIHTAFDSSLSSLLGFINNAQFLERLLAARNGKESPIVQISKALSLEFWLRDLAARRLIDGIPALPERTATVQLRASTKQPQRSSSPC